MLYNINNLLVIKIGIHRFSVNYTFLILSCYKCKESVKGEQLINKYYSLNNNSYSNIFCLNYS